MPVKANHCMKQSIPDIWNDGGTMESVDSVQRNVKISNKVFFQQILFILLVLSLQFTSVFKGVLPAAGLPSLSSSLKRWRLWKSPNVTIVG